MGFSGKNGAILLATVFVLASGICGEIIERTLVLHDSCTVSWTVDFDTENVTFTVKGKTKGWVGFGISPQGGMVGADLVMGGVDSKGAPYFSDRFATAKSVPKVDEQQDWHLISAAEDNEWTTIKFYRKINTCDEEEDLAITSDTTKFVWSLGASDEVNEKHQSRGVADVGILDPEVTPKNVSEFDVWRISVNTVIPTDRGQDTSYWCTLHKAPTFADGAKRHIVGFEVLLENEESLTHNHHLVIHKCIQNPGNEFFYPSHKGGECYEEDGTLVHDVAMVACQPLQYVWAKGGMPFFLPEEAGIPFNEGKEEYYALEIHYDNPDRLKNVSYETGVKVYHTTQLRNNSAGLLVTGHSVDFSMIVPPNSQEFVTVGHCSPNCTQAQVPKEGVNVFNVMLHSHLAGRKLKLRHFRNGTELPWIAYDNQYDFNYQQNKPLRNNVKFMPGDQLTYECTYTNGENATYGGLTTRHEMCEAFLMYWPVMPNLDLCDSAYALFPLFETLEIPITNFEDDFNMTANPHDPWIVSKNTTWSDYLSHVFDWSEPTRSNFQRAVRYDDHWAFCMGFESMLPEERKAYYHRNQKPGFFQRQMKKSTREGEEDIETITYPKEFKEYVPPQSTCEQGTTENSGNNPSTTENSGDERSTTENSTTSIVPSFVIVLVATAFGSIFRL